MSIKQNTTSLQDLLDAVNNLSDANVNLQSKIVNPSTSTQIVTPDSGYVGLSEVTVNPISLQEKTITIDEDGAIIIPDSDYDGLSKIIIKFVSNNLVCDPTIDMEHTKTQISSYSYTHTWTVTVSGISKSLITSIRYGYSTNNSISYYNSELTYITNGTTHTGSFSVTSGAYMFGRAQLQYIDLNGVSQTISTDIK